MNVFPLHRDQTGPAGTGTSARADGDEHLLSPGDDAPVPRYVCYPTTDHFIEAFDADSYALWLERRELTAVGPLAVYVHLPFCRAQCHFCACNHVIGRSYDRAQRYLSHLEQEVRMVCERLGARPRVARMEWGGGTPTYFARAELLRLMRTMRERFEFVDGGEFSIEVDPRSADRDTIAGLAEMGFNRLSVGVQDLDPDVQRAIHRVQPTRAVLDVLDSARRSGFSSINFDLICGLPRQSVERFCRTIDQVIDARPTRIALNGYEHDPVRYKAQRNIRSMELPSPAEQQAIFDAAGERLCAAGYLHVGLDHFALPEDNLGSAQLTGRLHRSFTGYTPLPETDLIGLGASAVSRVGPIYSQNERALPDYCDAIEQGNLPTMRGIELTKDDLARRAVIMSLMCHGRVSIESIEIAHLIDFNNYFAGEIAALRGRFDAGELVLDGEWLAVAPPGRRRLRKICAAFDRYLNTRRARTMSPNIL